MAGLQKDLELISAGMPENGLIDPGNTVKTV